MINLLKYIPKNKKGRAALTSAICVVLLLATGTYAANQKNKPDESKVAVEQTATAEPTTTKTAIPETTPTPQAQPSKTIVPKTGPTVKAKPKTQTSNRPSAAESNNSNSAVHSASNSTQDSNPPIPAAGILGLINQARIANGLNPLVYNSQLNIASTAKSQDMLNQNYFAHTNPQGKTDFDFIREAGYVFTFAGSNIAKGNFSEQTVFEAWMNSEGHRANILDPRAREFGYGVAGSYFTMMVGARG